MSQIQVNTLRCPYCHDSIAGAAPKAGCGSCLAWHHSACLLELGHCANCGVESSLKATLDAHFKESLAAYHRAEEARKATLCGKGLGCAAKAGGDDKAGDKGDAKAGDKGDAKAGGKGDAKGDAKKPKGNNGKGDEKKADKADK